MAERLDGKRVSAAVRAAVSQEVAALNAAGKQVSLAVIVVGEDPASRVYVNNKKKACAEVGIRSLEYALPADVSQAELLALVDKLNADPDVDGILCQLPLPRGLNADEVTLRICPDKDVDAFHPVNVGRLTLGAPVFQPCTPAGIMEILKTYDIPVEGKKCVVIGRSNIVGKPMALLLLAANATVEVCHSRTHDLAVETASADILISAVGKAGFVTADMVKEGAVVIDVGMNRDVDGKLCGDVAFDEVSEKASAITPVPGGVGPMTVAMLLENTVRAARLHKA